MGLLDTIKALQQRVAQPLPASAATATPVPGAAAPTSQSGTPPVMLQQKAAFAGQSPTTATGPQLQPAPAPAKPPESGWFTPVNPTVVDVPDAASWTEEMAGKLGMDLNNPVQHKALSEMYIFKQNLQASTTQLQNASPDFFQQLVTQNGGAFDANATAENYIMGTGPTQTGETPIAPDPMEVAAKWQTDDQMSAHYLKAANGMYHIPDEQQASSSPFSRLAGLIGDSFAKIDKTPLGQTAFWQNGVEGYMLGNQQLLGAARKVLGTPRDIVQTDVGGAEGSDMILGADGKWHQNTGMLPSSEGVPGVAGARQSIYDAAGFVGDPAMVGLTLATVMSGGLASPLAGGDVLDSALMALGKMGIGAAAGNALVRATDAATDWKIPPSFGSVVGLLGPGMVDIVSLITKYKNMAEAVSTVAPKAGFSPVKYFSGQSDIDALARESTKSASDIHLTDNPAEAQTMAGVNGQLKGGNAFVQEINLPADAKIAPQSAVDEATTKAIQAERDEKGAAGDYLNGVQDRVDADLKAQGFAGYYIRGGPQAAAAPAEVPAAKPLEAPPAPTNEAELSAQLQKPGWASMEAGQNTDKAAKQLADNTKLAKELQAQGFDAQVGEGTYGGKVGKNVFIRNMSVEDATRVAAEHGQESIFINDGQFYVTGEHAGEINPMATNEIKVGMGAPPADNYTAIQIGGKPAWFSGSPEFNTYIRYTGAAKAVAPTLPYVGAAVPAEITARAPELQALGISLEQAAAYQKTGTELTLRQIVGDYVSHAADIDKEAPALARALQESGGSPTKLASLITQYLGAEGETIEPKFARTLAHLVQNSEEANMLKAGSEIATAPMAITSGTQIKVFSHTPVQTLNPISGTGPMVLPYKVMAPTNAVMAPAIQTVAQRMSLMEQGAGQPTGLSGWANKLFPDIRRFMTPFSPYADTDSAAARLIQGSNQTMSSARAADAVRVNVIAENGLGRLASEKGQLSIPFKAGIPAEIQAKYAEKALNDIVENSNLFDLTVQEQKVVELIAKGNAEVKADLIAGGMDPAELPANDIYLHRVNIEKAGVQMKGGGVGGGRPLSLGGSALFRTRYLETQSEFIRAGGITDRDLLGIYSSQLQTLHKIGVDFQMQTELNKMGVSIESLIDPEVKAAPGEISATRDAIKTFRDRAASLNVLSRTLPVRAGAPDLVQQLSTQVNDIAAKYKKLAKAGKLASADLKAMKAELKPILTQADDAAKSLQDQYLKAASSLQQHKDMIGAQVGAWQQTPNAADLDKARGAFFIPASVFGVAKDDVFPNGIMEISKGGVGGVGDSQYLFPKYILDAVKGHYDTAVAGWMKNAQKLVNTARTAEVGTHLSFPFIQGVLLAARDPVAWARAANLSFASLVDPGVACSYMLREFAENPDAAAGFINDVRQVSESEYFSGVGAGGFIGKVPIVRNIWGRTGSSFDQFLDIGKWEIYKALYPTVSARYGDVGLSELGAMTRNMMGTTSSIDLGVGAQQRFAESLFLFAPRYTRSLFAVTADAVSGGIRGEEARTALGRLLAGGSLIYTAIAHAMGQEPDFDPTSSSFMSVRLGSNMVGLPGIFRSAMSTVAKSVAAAVNDPGVFYDPRRYLDNPIVRFWRSRAAAGTGDFMDILLGKDYIGQPTRSSWKDLLNVFGNAMSPFYVSQWQEANGNLADHIQVGISSMIMGRTIPISPSQLRDEHVYTWAEGTNIQLHDTNGQPFTPSSYSALPKYMKDQFDQFSPSDTAMVQKWHEANDSPLVATDQARTQAFQKIQMAGEALKDSHSPDFGDYQHYQDIVAGVTSDLATTINNFYGQQSGGAPALSHEQQIILDYNTQVYGPGAQDAYGNIDWGLSSTLERQFYAAHPEARQIIMQQYTSSMDPVDTERRKINWFLNDTYYSYVDGLWSPDGMVAFTDPASKWTDAPLPTLDDGRKPTDFASSSEYQRALTVQFYSEFKKGGIPTALADFPTGGKDAPSLGTLYGVGKPLTGSMQNEALAQQATSTVVNALMNDWKTFDTAVATDYLANPAHAEVLQDMRVWKKTDVPATLEQALAGYTAPTTASTSGGSGPGFLK